MNRSVATGAAVRRVLLTADTVGGVWTYAVELARALNHGGVAVELATMGAALTPAQRAAAAALPHTRVHESTWRLEWMEEPWDDIDRAGEWLLEIAARTRPDVVHLNQYAFGALPWTAPVLVAGHSCVCSWWEAVHGAPPPAEWERYRSAVRRGIHGADLVVTPSRTMLDALERHYGAPLASRVILNGRDPARFPPLPKRDALVGLGRLWDPAKNAAALAAAAPGIPWPVRVAGPTVGPDGSREAPPNVELLGVLDETAIAAELGRAAIAVLPARYEPFGLAALEAALAGCALVLGDIPSQREIWNGAAVFVPPDDPAFLSAATRDLCHDTARRARLARLARRRALRLSAGRMARSYLDAYAGLAGAPTTTPARETTACAS